MIKRLFYWVFRCFFAFLGVFRWFFLIFNGILGIMREEIISEWLAIVEMGLDKDDAQSFRSAVDTIKRASQVYVAYSDDGDNLERIALDVVNENITEPMPAVAIEALACLFRISVRISK